ncbi:hypothetical protein PV371_37375 [Streptomyces sp. TX20-6-3]|uniref:hypothetical protein n=1 Tax=Streptomyces sp. TX20-6-3 TaxID=3028705 RepID=UPI0029A22D08|nr:hypothetical protein [Streptomyces sp. TX20-6-3]MDX2565270.1 hypothetical protein [Streptomyces sp. TX20-6-3]
MPKQTITWTVLPNGGDATSVRFSLHVAPRLTTNAASGTLQDFPDWIDWPARLQTMTINLVFPELNLDVPAQITSTADSNRWKAIFQPSFTVQRNQFSSYTNRAVRSYPAKHIDTFISDRWSRFGGLSPTSAPSYTELIKADGFGSLVLGSLPGSAKAVTQGAARAARAKSLDGKIKTGPGTTPKDWAISYNPADAARPDLSFAQLERFHSRPANAPAPTGSVPQPDVDFHRAVAFTRDYPQLQRMLGLVIDLKVTDPQLVSRFKSAAQSTWAKAKVTWTPLLGAAAGVNVTPRTRCSFGESSFEALPQYPNTHDSNHGLLRLDNTDLFHVTTVDSDSVGLRAMQFADDISRARNEDSPASYKLPALSSDGISVARLGRAAQLANSVARAAALHNITFTSSGDKKPGDANVYLEDLIRGYRWDIHDEADSRWRSLMERQGQYQFLRQNQNVNVSDEGTQVVAPTTSTSPSDTDLYLSEYLARWTGWSLAVHRLGKALTDSNTMEDTGNDIDERLQFRARFSPAPHSLPRLRFGHRYKARARTVDIAGNGLPFTTEDAPKAAATYVTPTLTYRRSAPVDAPGILLRKPRGAGESDDRAIIRSDNAADSNVPPAERHIVPPRTAQIVAEQHGAFDTQEDGQPMNATVYADLVNRDKSRLESLAIAHQEPAPNENSWYFDADSVPIDYLPEFMTAEAVIEGLPGGTNRAVIPLRNGATAWPLRQSFRIRLAKGTAGWTWNASARVLEVTLAPGDIYRLRLSSKLTAATDLDQFTMWEQIKSWAEKWNQNKPASQQIDLDQIRQDIIAGKHWMFTPSRPLTLVHAVRTPLKTPAITSLAATREANGTKASLQAGIDLSRKSAGKIDIYGEWEMPYDEGPGSGMPGTRTFRNRAFSASVGRENGSNPGGDTLSKTGIHEFGDTKHRTVAYKAVTTSAFVEHFRAEKSLHIPGAAAVPLGVPVDAETVRIKDPNSGELYVPAPAGETNPATARGDYIIDPSQGTVRLTQKGKLKAPATVTVSYVGPSTKTTSAPRELVVPSSARPLAPVVRYVIPYFSWTRNPKPGGAEHIRKSGLRVYLERPWWSSGADEALAVLTWNDSNPVPSDGVLPPYVTAIGRDPVVASSPSPATVSYTDFDMRVNVGLNAPIEIPEYPGSSVRVAAHKVNFDVERDLWYADINIVGHKGGDSTFFPFIRLALARYQPHSMSGQALSPVVRTEITQLTASRTATVTGSGAIRSIAVQGRAYAATATGVKPQMHAIVETRMPGVGDPNLGWTAIGQPTPLNVSVTNNQAQGTGSVPIPAGPEAKRIRIEEYLTLPLGPGVSGTGRKLVYFDTLPIS